MKWLLFTTFNVIARSFVNRSPERSEGDEAIYADSPSPGGRELEGGGNPTLTLALSHQGRGDF
jgi:hypothetical protein